MSNNSHFGLFAGAFALLSLVSLYGSEIGPMLLLPEAHADEALPAGIARDTAVKTFATPRQLNLPPGLPPLRVSAPRPTLSPIRAHSPSDFDGRAASAAAEPEGGAATVLPNPASCPAANTDTRFAPAPATHVEPAVQRTVPAMGLGTGAPCPAAAPHTSVIAGASPMLLPAGPSGPSSAPPMAP